MSKRACSDRFCCPPPPTPASPPLLRVLPIVLQSLRQELASVQASTSKRIEELAVAGKRAVERVAVLDAQIAHLQRQCADHADELAGTKTRLREAVAQHNGCGEELAKVKTEAAVALTAAQTQVQCKRHHASTQQITHTTHKAQLRSRSHETWLTDWLACLLASGLSTNSIRSC
jgi:hypothetical protein